MTYETKYAAKSSDILVTVAMIALYVFNTSGFIPATDSKVIHRLFPVACPGS